MFAYTVYPRIQSVSRVDSYRRVERTSAVSAVRAVQSVWNSQFSEAVHARGHANETQAAAQRSQTAPQNSQALSPMTAETTAMQIQNSRETMLTHRGTKPVADGEYIRKYVRQLNEARTRTLQQRQNELRAKELRQNHGAAKSGLLT